MTLRVSRLLSSLLVTAAALAAAHLTGGQAGADSFPSKPIRIISPFTAGPPPHVLAEMLRMETGADINDVPYRQTPQLISDLLAGRLQIHFSAGEPIASMIRDGKMKAYAVTGAVRDPTLPNIPTMAEAGLPQLT